VRTQMTQLHAQLLAFYRVRDVAHSPEGEDACNIVKIFGCCQYFLCIFQIVVPARSSQFSFFLIFKGHCTLKWLFFMGEAGAPCGSRSWPTG
jgi:hypothetical protein